jgi:hypothetical protein
LAFFSHSRRDSRIAKIHTDAVGIVLTMDPWLEISNHRERLDNQILEQDRSHVLFCSIDNYENTLQCTSETSLLNSIRESAKPKFVGWGLFHVHQDTTDDKELRRAYPFEARIGEINPGWNIGGFLADEVAPHAP